MNFELEHPRRITCSSIALLVVIAILAVPAGMWLPVLLRAKEKAKRIGCLNSLKQLSLGSMLYKNDNNGPLSGASWSGSYYTEAAKGSAAHCGSSLRRTFGRG